MSGPKSRCASAALSLPAGRSAFGPTLRPMCCWCRTKNVAELRARSVARDISSVSMNAGTRSLLEHFKEKVHTLGEAIPVVENRSLCFYDDSGDFFAEFIPMSGYVRLLVPGTFEELEDADGIAADAKGWMWIPSAVHTDSGAVIDVWTEEGVERAIQLLRGSTLVSSRDRLCRGWWCGQWQRQGVEALLCRRRSEG